MYIQIEEPTETISKKAVQVWRLSNALGHAAALIILVVLLFCEKYFAWYDWVGTALYVLGGLIIISSIYSIFLEPVLIQRRWRYQVDKEFVQLKFGRWSQQHILIPMEKVEYVRTEQGPLLRRYNLYTLEVGTTASNHKIPAIPAEHAMKLKAQIAVFAKIRDDDNLQLESRDEVL